MNKDKSIVEIFVDVVVDRMTKDIQEVLDLLPDNIGDECTESDESKQYNNIELPEEEDK
jgi:hypothetical protein